MYLKIFGKIVQDNYKEVNTTSMTRNRKVRKGIIGKRYKCGQSWRSL